MSARSCARLKRRALLESSRLRARPIPFHRKPCGARWAQRFVCRFGRGRIIRRSFPGVPFAGSERTVRTSKPSELLLRSIGVGRPLLLLALNPPAFHQMKLPQQTRLFEFQWRDRLRASMSELRQLSFFMRRIVKGRIDDGEATEASIPKHPCDVPARVDRREVASCPA